MDVSSNTDICNLTLDLLSAGVVTDINNPNDATEELLARHYELCRKKLLRQHPWNFAIKRAVLAADSETPAFGYSYQFSFPADFIRLLHVCGTDDLIVPPSLYQVEGNKILISDTYSNVGALSIKYIYDIKTVSSFDPLFISLLSYDLALAIAYKVTDSNTNVQRISELRKEALALARAVDGQERPPTRIESSRALRARRSGSYYRDSTRYSFNG